MPSPFLSFSELDLAPFEEGVDAGARVRHVFYARDPDNSGYGRS
jgi:hypothetical protein